MENKGNILMQRYELGRQLGQGNFSKVHYGRNLKTGQSVAVKVIDKEKVLTVGLIEQIKREVSVMRRVKHLNILQLYEVMATKSKIYLVVEYARGGELFSKVARGRLQEDDARKYFQQLIGAIDFCHRQGVYHRDLKPENLLLDENEDLKVSDFGLSALAESKRQDGLLHTTCGTPAYVAPEVINRKGYDGAKADIWSCGVILFVLLAGYLPFHDSNLIALYRKITKAEYKCPNWVPLEVRRLLSKILDPNPLTRISIAKLVENPWFRKGLNCQIIPENEEGISTHSDGERGLVKAPSLNAFDIISLSSGFDLSGLFVGPDEKNEVQFTSVQPFSIIISRLEEIAKQLRLKLTKKEGGLLKFEGWSDKRSKGALLIDAEIFEITPSFHLVEVKNSSGDALEFQSVLKQDIRPGLKDIVWAWQR